MHEEVRAGLERDLVALEERFDELQKQTANRPVDWGEQYDRVSNQIAQARGDIDWINAQIKQYVLD